MSTTRTYRLSHRALRAAVSVVLLVSLVFAALMPATAAAVTLTKNEQKAVNAAVASTQAANAAAGQGAGAGAGTSLGINVNGKAASGGTAVQLLVLFTVLALAPSILIMMTGFTRIMIVMSFVRNALGTPTMPPNQVMIGLSLFLTLFVMFPTFAKINHAALQPYQKGTITQSQALSNAQEPLRKFMFQQVGDDDLALFVKLSDLKQPKTRADVPTYVLVPSFLISEIKTAFQIGFLVFIPFLIIDMVVASTLMSMGMIMLPPVMISLPFKILLFVLVDGWHLTIQSLVLGFGPQ